mgnify:CR=1 FL=1|jgi:hypothetical protein
MATDPSTKPVPKRKVSRKASRKRRRSPPPDRTRLGALIVIAVIVVLGIIGVISLDDRHWHAFDDAGQVAHDRGNYEYAARMHQEALQIANELRDDALIRSSQQALDRAYAAQERSTTTRR